MSKTTKTVEYDDEGRVVRETTVTETDPWYPDTPTPWYPNTYKPHPTVTYCSNIN